MDKNKSHVDSWYVFNKTTYVGVLNYDEDKKFFSLVVEGSGKRVDDAVKILNSDKHQEWFKRTMFNRIFPPNRVDAAEILRELGLPKYDAWEILKIDRLMGCNDLVWMSKNKDPNEFYTKHVLGEDILEMDKEKARKNGDTELLEYLNSIG